MSDQATAYLIGLALVLAFFAFVFRPFRRPPPTVQPVDARMEAIERRLSAAERQLDGIAVTVQHLPTADTVHDMAMEIAKIGGDMKALQASVNATNNLVVRIDQWLLTKGA